MCDFQLGDCFGLCRTALLAALFVIGMPALGFGDERPGVVLQARTESPRDTFESFRSLSDQLEVFPVSTYGPDLRL